MDEVKIKEVVITNLTIRGDGHKEPYRKILEVWDLETGEKIAENDIFKTPNTRD